MTAQPRRRAIDSTSSIRHGRPKTWTGRIARVRGVRSVLDQVRIDPEAVLLDVDEARDGALVEEAVGRGDEAERGRDDLVALADLQGAHAQVESGRAARAGDALTAARERGDPGLEPRRKGAQGQHVALQDLGDELELARSDIRPGERDSGRADPSVELMTPLEGGLEEPRVRAPLRAGHGSCAHPSGNIWLQPSARLAVSMSSMRPVCR